MKKTKLFALLATCILVFALPLTANAAETDDVNNQMVLDQQAAEDFVMPTVDTMPDQTYAYLVEGTDQYNDQLKEIGLKNGINPIFLKVIMSMESCGDINAKNGGHIGLFQIGKSFGYDTNKMMTDSEYAIQCACEVIRGKADVADSLKCKHSVYYVAKFYNGEGKYGKMAGYLFNQLGGGDKTTSIYIGED